jgi:hypothetical protein
MVRQFNQTEQVHLLSLQNVVRPRIRPGVHTAAPVGEDLALSGDRLSVTDPERTQMQVEDKLVNLFAGHRSHRGDQDRISPDHQFLLSPLIRYKQEMLRER